jgi:hypothetical protein
MGVLEGSGTVKTGAASEIGLIRRTHSASSSVSGVVSAGFATTGLARRDSEVSDRERGDVVIGEGERGRKREGDEEGSQMQGTKKKRRVAPMLVNVPAVVESPSESAVSGTMDPPSVPPSAEP